MIVRTARATPPRAIPRTLLLLAAATTAAVTSGGCGPMGTTGGDTGTGGRDVVGGSDAPRGPDGPVSEDFVVPLDDGVPPGDAGDPPDATLDDAPAGDTRPPPRDGGPPPGDGGFFGASRCAGAGFTICEDFESGNWDTAVWTTRMTNATLAVDTMRAARGTHALHIHTMTMAGATTGATGMLSSTRGFPAASNTYWGRAFVWMAAASPTTHSTLFESGGQLPYDGGTLSVSQRFSISGHMLDASYDSSPRPPTTDYARRSATAMPLNRWACLEWQFKGDTNEVHYFLDGAELTDMAVTPATRPVWTAPSWTRVNVGLQLYRADTIMAFDMWLDEVAIHTARISCTR